MSLRVVLAGDVWALIPGPKGSEGGGDWSFKIFRIFFNSKLLFIVLTQCNSFVHDCTSNLIGRAVSNLLLHG